MTILGFVLLSFPGSLFIAIAKGEAFVLSSLGDSLRLPVLRSVQSDSFLREAWLDTTDFGTSFLLNTARFSSSAELKEASVKAAARLYERRLPGDLFKYYPLRRSCEPDADDVSAISYELALFGYELDNKDALLAWQDSSGGFFTWMTKGAKANDIDAEVNSNVARWLFHLGYRDERFLGFMDSQVRDPSLHYCWSPLAFYYTMSRLIRDEPGAIPDSLRAEWSKVILAKTLSLRPYGSPLNIALAANTLINLGYDGPELDDAISSLTASQRDDGSWPGFAFYIKKGYCFGSPELTTVIALEALYRYKPK
ncbi:MAG: hypothetical protein ABIM74_00620 [candidate division WOR-3 bacterium]